ncbi:hypothetical protein [Trichloromonas sp.]|uniref:hypothetical protein n=1 Tax=Trichloromonas sp. TaxID=3069249 RepID=UPI003D81486F
MVVGFNHNFRYKGGVYHVQTEDGGVKSPQVVTLLYCGGTILSSKKTSYADLCHKDNLTALVEGLMKEQHREMLRRLKDGEFDGVIHQKLSSPAEETAPSRTSAPPVPTVPEKIPVVPSAPPAPAPRPVAPVPVPAVAPEKDRQAVVAASLDDIILSYLIGEDD